MIHKMTHPTNNAVSVGSNPPKSKKDLIFNVIIPETPINPSTTDELFAGNLKKSRSNFLRK